MSTELIQRAKQRGFGDVKETARLFWYKDLSAPRRFLD